METALLVFILVVIAGMVTVQIFLSKKETGLAGLVLPVVSLSVSILVALSVFAFGAIARFGNEDTIFLTSLYVFVLFNIPTVVLLVVYAACRGRRNRRRALEKMRKNAN